MKNGPECDCGICRWCAGTHPDYAELRAAEHAREMGRDCARNGANTINCHSSLFATPELTAAWEAGKREIKPED